MKEFTAWAEIVGEGEQEKMSELMGLAPPIVRVQHIVYQTDTDGKPMMNRAGIQRAVGETVENIHKPLAAYLYLVQGGEDIAHKLPDCQIGIVSGSSEDDPTWYWSGDTRSLSGYATIEKAILNALMSIEEVSKSFGGEKC